MGNTAEAITPPRLLRDFIDSRRERYTDVAKALEISPSHLTRLMDGTSPISYDSPGLGKASMADRLLALYGEAVRECFPPREEAAR